MVDFLIVMEGNQWLWGNMAFSSKCKQCLNICVFPSVQIDLPPSMVITKGLPGKYTAVQMHLHWGGWDLEASGAEHTIDGIRYMAEVG